MADHSLSAGERIAQVRKVEGLSQQQLAARIGYSLGQVRKVEQGERAASPAFVAAAARALGREVWELYGQPYDDPLETPPGAEHTAVPELRRALVEFDDPDPAGPPLTLKELSGQLNTIRELNRRARFAEVTTALPDVLRHLRMATETAPAGHGRKQAFTLLTYASSKAMLTAYQFGYLDLAGIAAERCRWAAAECGDPLWLVASEFNKALILLYSGSYRAGLRVIDRAYMQTEDLPESPDMLAVRGALHLRASILSARVTDGATAESHLAEAREIAQRLGDQRYNHYGTGFRASNVDIHSVSVPVELSDGTTAVTRAASLVLPPDVAPCRHGHHYIDTARAWLFHSDRQRALEALNQARRIAPQLTRYHPQVHETARTIALQDKRTTGSLSNFVAWLGLKL